MPIKQKSYILVCGPNKFEFLYLIIWSWVRALKLSIIVSFFAAPVVSVLGRLFFLKKYRRESIQLQRQSVGMHKGLWYLVSKKTIELSRKFYDQEITRKNKLVVDYNNILRTNKFEGYIKEQIATRIFILLNDLHLVRLTHLKDKVILAVKNPINEFVIKEMENDYAIKYRIRWVKPLPNIVYPVIYYCWLFVEFIKRGLVFNRPKKSYKISKQSAWGFYWPTLRDDMVVDDKRFKKSDILMLKLSDGSQRRIAYQEAKKRGFAAADFRKLKFNVNKNIFDIAAFYFWLPIKTYFKLLTCRQSYLYYYVFLFHRDCFGVEILMNSYNIGCHISCKDHGDYPWTIILNKYGTKDVIVPWTDHATYKAHDLASMAHNIYFSWGDTFYDHNSIDSFIDKKVNVGCIFKAQYNKALDNREEFVKQISGFKPHSETVVFFDSGFDDHCHHPERFFIEYLEIVKEFAKQNPDLNVLLKPKSSVNYELKISDTNRSKFKRIWAELISCDNFTYLDSVKWSLEEIIALSDVSISMGMNTPAMIALICGKNAFYYDNTGNNDHPLAQKYRNVIVFDNKDPLFKQIGNALNKKFNYRDIISEEEMRGYDAFPDSNALERFKENLYQLTLTD